MRESTGVLCKTTPGIVRTVLMVEEGTSTSKSTSIRPWRKVSIACRNAEELWNTLQRLHQQEPSWLGKILAEATPTAPASAELSITHESLTLAIEAWIAKGNKITKLLPSASARDKLNLRLDVDALLAGLDDEPAEEPEQEQSIEDEDFAEVTA